MSSLINGFKEYARTPLCKVSSISAAGWKRAIVNRNLNDSAFPFSLKIWTSRGIVFIPIASDKEVNDGEEVDVNNVNLICYFNEEDPVHTIFRATW